MQAKVMLLQSNDPQLSIILLIKSTVLQNSVLKKSPTMLLMTKFSKKGRQLISSGVVMVSMAKVLYHAIPAKIVENFII